MCLEILLRIQIKTLDLILFNLILSCKFQYFELTKNICKLFNQKALTYNITKLFYFPAVKTLFCAGWLSLPIILAHTPVVWLQRRWFSSFKFMKKFKMNKSLYLFIVTENIYNTYCSFIAKFWISFQLRSSRHDCHRNKLFFYINKSQSYFIFVTVFIW